MARGLPLAGLILVTILALSSDPATGAGSCGGDGERPCTIAPASFAGKKPAQCPGGAFFDPIDGGTCWRCPSGARRTVFHVKSPDACERPAHQQFDGATRHGRGTGVLRTDCPRGQFWDPNGYCWSCPAGHGRTAHPVTSGQACAASVRAARMHAQHTGGLACPAGSFFDLIDGGTCWRCPQGYSRTASHVKAGDACAAAPLAGLGAALGACDQGHTNVGGVCSRVGNCGAAGRRPCLLGERIPSCNAGLKEDFKHNVCAPLRPGETPFLGGLASLTSVYGEALRGLCRETLGGISVPSQTDLAVGATCAKNVFVGAACDWLAEQSGAGVAEGANAVLSAGPAATQFRQQVDRAYATAPCNAHAEKLAPATRHGRGGGAIGTDCGSGQFWDPNGSCWSCPRDYTRTLHPVDSRGACVDKFGGELARSTCSVFVAAERSFGGGARCAVEVMQSGMFVTEPLDFQSASREYCMATGELAYAVYGLIAEVRKTPRQKEEQLTTALQRLVAAVKRDTAQARRHGAIAVKAAGVAAEGKNTVDRLDDLASCRR